MRLLRLALLTDFFLKKKNFNRANKLINIGIFLAVFAFSASIISFVIERKINDKEYELISSQNEITQMQVLSTWLKNSLQTAYLEFDQEQRDYEKELYLNETKLNFKLMSSKDFYEPYIFFTIIENKELSKYLDEQDLLKDFEGFFEMGEESQFVETWRLKNWSKTFENFKDKKATFDKIDPKNYSRQNFLTDKAKLFSEIKNINSSSDLDYTNQLRYDYVAAYQYRYATTNLFQSIVELLDLVVSSINEDNKLISEEILNLSKLETNLILASFLMQFVIFIIIQLFEISSLSRDKKVKLL